MRQQEIEFIMSDQVSDIIYLGEQDQVKIKKSDMENKMAQALKGKVEKS